MKMTDLHENDPAGGTHFHKNGFALSLVLKQRHKRTRKWPICFALTTLRDWLKSSRHFFIQSGVKPNPIAIRLHTFSRALRQLHEITSSSDWFTELFLSFVIGWSNYFGFGFTALN